MTHSRGWLSCRSACLIVPSLRTNSTPLRFRSTFNPNIKTSAGREYLEGVGSLFGAYVAMAVVLVVIFSTLFVAACCCRRRVCPPRDKSRKRSCLVRKDFFRSSCLSRDPAHPHAHRDDPAASFFYRNCGTSWLLSACLSASFTPSLF